MLRVSLIAAVMIGAPAVFAAQPHPSLPSETVPDGLGVNIHFIDAQPGELDMVAEGGFRWIRMDFNWAAIEKERGKYDFAAYDRLIAALDARKLHAVLILDYGNPLYEPDQSVISSKGIEAFSKWAAAAATHFKGHGILWEIWNEPNGGFWKPAANVSQYTKLAVAASKAIHDAAPSEAIVGPATATVDFKFLDGCFQAGLLQWWDAVSVHPYRQQNPESVTADYKQLRQSIAKYAPPGKSIPILSGEWGYSSAWKDFDDRSRAKCWPGNGSSISRSIFLYRFGMTGMMTGQIRTKGSIISGPSLTNTGRVNHQCMHRSQAIWLPRLLPRHWLGSDLKSGSTYKIQKTMHSSFANRASTGLQSGLPQRLSTW